MSRRPRRCDAERRRRAAGRFLGAWARAPWRWAGIVSSPLGRCRAAARTLGASLGLTPHIEPRFREIGFGEREGRPWTDLLREHGDALFAFWACPGDHPAAGGEDYAAFDGRVWAAVVSHGGPIRVILRRALELPVGRLFDIDVPYGSLARASGLDRRPGLAVAPIRPLITAFWVALGFSPVSRSGADCHTGDRRQAIRWSCIRSWAS